MNLLSKKKERKIFYATLSLSLSLSHLPILAWNQPPENFIRNTWMLTQSRRIFFHTFVVTFDKYVVDPPVLFIEWHVLSLPTILRSKKERRVTYNCALMHFNLWQQQNIDDGSFMIYNFVWIACALALLASLFFIN